MSQTETGRSATRLPLLDLLRFTAALLVLGYHYLYAGAMEGIYHGIAPITGLSLGWLGVDIFFVISGLVIAISTEGKRPTAFLRARFLRLFPAFFICSLTGTVAWGIFDPDKMAVALKWLAGLTFLPGLFGYEPRLSVYWTLKVEVTFYLWIGGLIALGIWQRHLTALMISWLAISLANQLLLGSTIIANVLITDYAGHFCAGIVLYQCIRGQRSAWMPLILGMSWLAFYHYNLGYFSYMNRVYDFAPDGRFEPFIPLLIVALVFGCASATNIAVSNRLCSVLGLASYPLYLIHTDVGHWPRMMLDKLGYAHPNLLGIVTPGVHMTLAIVCSIAFSIIIAVYIEPRMRAVTKFALGGGRV